MKSCWSLWPAENESYRSHMISCRAVTDDWRLYHALHAYTLSDINSSDNIVEILAWCRKFCLTKYFVWWNFCLIRYLLTGDERTDWSVGNHECGLRRCCLVFICHKKQNKKWTKLGKIDKEWGKRDKKGFNNILHPECCFFFVIPFSTME